MKAVSTIIFLLFGSLAQAESIVAQMATIRAITSYSEQGVFDGDIFIQLEQNPAACPGGYWLRHADTSGYKSTVSFLLSAFHSGTAVTIMGYNDSGNIWIGSGTPTCRTDQITLTK
jgi:hypothetical protein